MKRRRVIDLAEIFDLPANLMSRISNTKRAGSAARSTSRPIYGIYWPWDFGGENCRTTCRSYFPVQDNVRAAEGIVHLREEQRCMS
jgi:hypothetical protein